MHSGLNQEDTMSPLVSLCHEVHEILRRYYDLGTAPDFKSFLLPTDDELGSAGRVYYHAPNESDEVYLGVQFGTPIERDVRENEAMSTQSLAVVAEETSHLRMILDAAQWERRVTVFNLEVMGEIDRFLALMHWNAAFPGRRLDQNWKNLHEICDHVFSGERFPPDAQPFYFEIESHALSHLRTAFSRSWDSSRFDFSSIDRHAQTYLKKLRLSLFHKTGPIPCA